MEEAVDEGHSTPISLHRARWLAMALLLLLYVGGFLHAWQALAVPRYALPTKQARQVQTALAPAAHAAPPQSQLCCSALRLHCTLLPAEQPREDWDTLDIEALATAHLQPALQQLTTDVHIGSSLLLYPPRLPFEQLQWDAQRKAHLLPGVAAAVWGQQVQQLAWSAGPAHSDPSLGPAAASVLLYFPPAAHQPLLLELAGGDAANSMELGDGSLLLIVNPDIAGGGSGVGGIKARLALDILSWLLQPLKPRSSSSSSTNSSAGDNSSSSSNDDGSPTLMLRQLRRSLTAGCAAAAATALERFMAAAEAAPTQPVTAGMASQAAEVVQLLEQASRGQKQGEEEGGSRHLTGDPGPEPAFEQLAAARTAWHLAHQLLSDPGTGALQAFPPEHALAVLMSLALPLTVVLIRAAVGELWQWSEPWRVRREARRQALRQALWRQAEAGRARVQRAVLHFAAKLRRYCRTPHHRVNSC
ncbi:hypothetical protein D9Q98_009400 [Chlorella vulgaris]|uniref:Uncharacterized protein n=1 Tax=Chlorella vulgaris TaxID=3077 RepID=A0A9D4TPN2_CHLVU|nr:hypothetical protein D9Q98_009400 [Chlorella vulgaris]